VHIRTKSPHF